MFRHEQNLARSLSILALAFLVASGARAADTFIKSDDYEERETPVGVFLTDDDYRIMVEDIERNDTSFDWGWVLTPGFQDAGTPPPDTRPKALKWLPRKDGQRLTDTPRELAFDFGDYKKIYIPPVENFAGIMKDDLLASIRDSFVEAVSMFNLEVVETREAAHLELAMATMDQMRNVANVPVYGIRIEPFVLLELRLVDLATGQKLVLLRNRKHGPTPADAALNFADDFVKFLR